MPRFRIDTEFNMSGIHGEEIRSSLQTWPVQKVDRQSIGRTLLKIMMIASKIIESYVQCGNGIMTISLSADHSG